MRNRQNGNHEILYHFMRAKPKKDNRAHKGVVRMDDFWFLVSEHFMANRVQFMNECVNGLDRLFALFGWDSVCFFHRRERRCRCMPARLQSKNRL